MGTSFEFNPFSGTFDIVTDANPSLAYATPTYIRAGHTTLIPVDTQMLFYRPIKIDGVLHNDGLLASVT